MKSLSRGFLLLILEIITFQLNIPSALSINSIRNLRDPSTETDKDGRNEKRPLIYTFFEIGDDVTLQEHAKLLATWAELWSEAGWEPRVLTLEDAKKHPNYEKFSKEIIYPGPLHYLSFDYMCLMRWLAMAVQGTGGWMSDYDVIPMGINVSDGHFLPNFGAFTNYDGTVPSLMSGTAEEWERMSQHVLGIAAQSSHFFFSDMLAMQQLHEQSPLGYMTMHQIYDGLPYVQRNLINCDSLKGVIAAHLSRSRIQQAVTNGLVTIPDETEKNESVVAQVRSSVAKELSIHWKQQCFSKIAMD